MYNCEYCSAVFESEFELAEHYAYLHYDGVGVLINNSVVVMPEITEEFLNSLKESRKAEVDRRTDELIEQGFLFDGVRFSLSANAQINWLGLKSLELYLSWPVELATIESDVYSLLQENMPAFVGQAAGAVQAHLASGRAIKVLINNSITKEDLDLVEDNR